MTALLIFIMNLPRAGQRTIAGSLGAVFAALLCMITYGAVSVLKAQADEIWEARQARARFERLLAMDSTIIPAVVPNYKQEFWAGESEPVIQAALQNKLKSIAGDAGAGILSAGEAPTLEKNGIRYVGLRANLQGELPAIHNTLLQLETGRPYLIVRELTVRSIGATGGLRLKSATDLSVQLTVYGALNPAEFSVREGGRR